MTYHDWKAAKDIEAKKAAAGAEAPPAFPEPRQQTSLSGGVVWYEYPDLYGRGIFVKRAGDEPDGEIEGWEDGHGNFTEGEPPRLTVTPADPEPEDLD